MGFASKRSDDLSAADLGWLRRIEPPELLATLLGAVKSALGEVAERDITLPGSACEHLQKRWSDPKWQDRLRRGLRAAVAAALSERMPPHVAKPLGDLATDKILYPWLRAIGDELIERLCPHRPS